MKYLIMQFIFICILFSLSFSSQDYDPEVWALVQNGKYKEAIPLLKKGLKDPGISKMKYYFWLGYSYQNLQDFKKAYKYCKKAAEIDKRLNVGVISVLDDMERWDDVIEMAEPEIQNGVKNPSLLGSLFGAYWKLNMKEKAEQIILLLKNTDYPSKTKQEIKYYVLSYYYLWKSDTNNSIDYLTKIESLSLIKFAKNSSKFTALFSDSLSVSLFNEHEQKLRTIQNKENDIDNNRK